MRRGTIPDPPPEVGRARSPVRSTTDIINPTPGHDPINACARSGATGRCDRTTAQRGYVTVQIMSEEGRLVRARKAECGQVRGHDLSHASYKERDTAS